MTREQIASDSKELDAPFPFFLSGGKRWREGYAQSGESGAIGPCADMIIARVHMPPSICNKAYELPSCTCTSLAPILFT